MARPKKERSDSRGSVFGVRLTADERAALAARAAASGVSASDFARAAVLGAPIGGDRRPSSDGTEAGPAAVPPPTRPPDGVASIVALNRVGVNLNQIARSLNAGLGYVPAELAQALARLDALLDDWQGVQA